MSFSYSSPMCVAVNFSISRRTVNGVKMKHVGDGAAQTPRKLWCGNETSLLALLPSCFWGGGGSGSWNNRSWGFELTSCPTLNQPPWNQSCFWNTFTLKRVWGVAAFWWELKETCEIKYLVKDRSSPAGPVFFLGGCIIGLAEQEVSNTALATQVDPQEFI